MKKFIIALLISVASISFADEKNIIDFTKKVKKYVSHVHISDTQGINGEGIQIHEGDTNFKPIFEELKDIDYSWVTEIWAGHLNNGKEQYKEVTRRM